jgi:hypothetical protein
VGDVADHREIVRDEEIGQAQHLLQVHEQVQHLGLHRDVERRNRLVGSIRAAAPHGGSMALTQSMTSVLARVRRSIGR